MLHSFHKTTLTVLALLTAAVVEGQTFSNFYSFSNSSTNANYPYYGLTYSGGRYYGGASRIGSTSSGAIFSISTNGTGYTNLYTFPGGVGGANPQATLTVQGSKIYGTTYAGGTNGYGMVYSINTDGSGFTNLHSFTSGTDGYYPEEGVLLLGKTLYGTVYYGGNSGGGVLYAMNTDGSSFTNLHAFYSTSYDGYYPWGKLIAVDNTIYGTTYQGGTNGYGTIFRINSDGSGYANLYSFQSSTDGANPRAALLAVGTKLYGTTGTGGARGSGTVFSINLDGTGFQVIHAFTSTEGSTIWGQLALAGATLYGIANGGGTNGYGTLFSVNINGTGFAKLYDFNNATNSVGFPQTGVLISGNTLIGTGVWGGNNGGGGIYTFTLAAPTVNISATGGSSVVYWPNSAVSYTLQSTTNLTTPNWQAVTNGIPVAAVTVTNQSGNQFFRLLQN